jgi:hypothetical protein
MDKVLGSGYLARVEANHLGVVHGPDVVYLQLIRSFGAEGQRTSMFAEMTPGQALHLIKRLEVSVREALISCD